MLETMLGADLVQFLRIVLDVATLSVIFYFLYRLLKVVRIPLLFNQVGILLFIYVVAALLRLDTVLWVFQNVFSWIVVGVLVVFQPELRALVMRTDYARLFHRDRRKQFAHTMPDFEKIGEVVKYLVKAKRGALFVFPRHVDLEYIINSKVEINADLNVELLQTIFSHDTALHDGAVIIQSDKITHAGCFLPTERGNTRSLNSFGSRHRAAIGLSQNSDAVIMIVSEEFGSVSLVFDGEILYDIGIKKSCAYIAQLLDEAESKDNNGGKDEDEKN